MSFDLRELIQRYSGTGQNASEVIDEIHNTLLQIQMQDNRKDVKHWPDPPQVDEMISPPCELPRMGPEFSSKVLWDAKRLPDPVPE